MWGQFARSSEGQGWTWTLQDSWCIAKPNKVALIFFNKASQQYPQAYHPDEIEDKKGGRQQTLNKLLVVNYN